MNAQMHLESSLGRMSLTKHHRIGQPITAMHGPWDRFPPHLQDDETCCRNSLYLCFWCYSWEHVSLIQALMDGLSHTSLVAVTDPIHLPRLIKCHECPFLNYLKLLTSPNLFIRHLSPSPRGTRQRCSQTLLQKCPSDFNMKLILCVNGMFSMLTFKEKHRK